MGEPARPRRIRRPPRCWVDSTETIEPRLGGLRQLASKEALNRLVAPAKASAQLFALAGLWL